MEPCGLPGHANLAWLRTTAKHLQRRARAGDEAAIELVEAFHPRRPDPAVLQLSSAQLVIARRFGFASWPKLVRHLELADRYRSAPHEAPAATGTDDDAIAWEFLRLGCLTYGGDDPTRLEQARALLDAHPSLPQTSIHVAAAVGDLAAVTVHVAADPSGARAPGGPHAWEPLLYLAYCRVIGAPPAHDPVAVARLLLAHGADPNAGFLWEGLVPPFTALTGVIGGGEDDPSQSTHPDMERLATVLLEAGADPNDGQALYNRAFTPGDRWLEILFAHGLGTGDGGPWAVRLEGQLATPREMLEDLLLPAASLDFPDRVALLLAHGVDPDGDGTRHPVYRDRSPLGHAIRSGAGRVADLLRAAGATEPPLDPSEILLAACMRGDADEVERLVAADPELPAHAAVRDPERIRLAGELGRSDAIRLLARIGVDVNAGSPTALHEAALHGHRETAELLLELGADPTRHDLAYHATPAGWADHAGHMELAAFLAEREAAGR
jgi:hypothetical protein